MADTLSTSPDAPAVDARLFDADGGQSLDVGSDQPFLLDDDRMWLVQQGHVEVFCVRLDRGKATGARHHLLRVGAGQPLFGLGPEATGGEWGLLAVGTSGTRLLPVRRAALRALGRDPAHAGEVAALLDHWIHALCAAITGDLRPKRVTELAAGEPHVVEERGAARPRPPIGWIRHSAGHALLLGRPELEVNGHGFTPVARSAWLELLPESRFELVETGTLVADDDAWFGLSRLHALVLRYMGLQILESQGRERERLEAKAAHDRSALQQACARLAVSLDPELAEGEELAGPTEAERRTDPRAPDALFLACRLVGRAAGVTVVPHPAGEGSAVPRDPLEAIARASRLRMRRLALRGEWWREDNGPMVARLADGDHPVALLRDRKGQYRLHHPVDRTEVTVTREVADTLHPFAHAFYRPFAATRLGVRDVLQFGFRGCQRDLWMLLACGLAAAALGMVPSIATGVLFNDVIPAAARPALVQMTVILIVCALVTSLFTVARGIALLRIESRMGASVQAAVWDRLLGLPLAFFRPYTAGDLAVRAMSIDAMRQVISGTTVTALMGGLFSVGNVALMFWYSASMAWRASLLIGLVILLTGIGSYFQLRYNRQIYTLQTKVSGLVLQLLGAIAKLRVAGAEVQAFSRWADRFAEQRRLQYGVRRIQNWVSALNAAFPVLAYLVIFWIALPLITEGQEMRTGDFMAFLSAYASSSAALLSTCMALLSTLNIVPLYEQARPILEALPEVGAGKADPGVLTGEIEVQHAVFRYNPDGPPVLRDVTLQIQPGQFLALVGPSGSGKSTILRLLLGFETLESGAIYFDGQELGGLDVQAVRRQIGVVLQSGRLMSGDIFTNIVGSSLATLDEAWDAARMAGLDDDVRAMPMGMHTVISEGGGTLSGGQRQRLLIARAIVHRPRLLFFDEATSALDNRTQAIVSRSLEQLQATRIVVAHRLSTIVNADRIIVLDRGRIVQSGRYEELMAREGLFRELARRQIA